MWSLGKVFLTPEVVRVYIGSFWDKPYQNKENQKLFEMEQNDLLKVTKRQYFSHNSGSLCVTQKCSCT
jgi:hypothetical protein